MSNAIDAKTLKRLFLAGAKRIDSQKDYINELNVFPVPDGDTGSNMTMTILSAAKAVNAIEEPTMENVCKAISSGSLRGARGNSGVILSQLFRGFTRAIQKSDALGVEEIAAGFSKAVDTAYKAVMKPKEGTILTVAKGVADKAEELSVDPDQDLIPFCEAIVAHGYEVLKKTPDMLPVLKEAGVVDSGGQGLMEVLQGALDGLTGKVTEVFIPEIEKGSAQTEIVKPDRISTDDIKFGYCTEFIILLDKPLSRDEEKELKKYLLSIGDSLVCVADDEICKIHVHTNHPGNAFEKGLTYGALSNMKVDNMRIEHQEKLIKDAESKARQQRAQEAEEERLSAASQEKPEKELGFIAISTGDGFKEIFTALGVDSIIEGGQTMNPSTEDILEAVEGVPAKNVIVLPNNKNIILAAQQAAELSEDKKVIVLPTTTIPQGIAAMVGYIPDSGVDENVENMKEGYEFVSTGQVTYAVRDTMIDGKSIHDGDIMGLDDGGIEAVGKDVTETTLNLVLSMVDEDSELISLYYGEDIKEEEAESMADSIREVCPDCEVEINYGGQPIYYYLISVE